MSDSSYVAVTNHRKPFDIRGRPAVLELIDDEWAADVIEDEDLPTKLYELPLLLADDDDDDVGGIDGAGGGGSGEQAVITTGTSSSAVTQRTERRKREEGWNDLGLDQLEPRSLRAEAGKNGN
jgi:hypothetical protein